MLGLFFICQNASCVISEKIHRSNNLFVAVCIFFRFTSWNGCHILAQRNHWLTPISTVFQLYPGDSSHYSCLSLVSPLLGWGSEGSCPRTLSRASQRIQCWSNPGPLDYESKTIPVSYAGPAFSPFPTMFSKGLFLSNVKVVIVW